MPTMSPPTKPGTRRLSDLAKRLAVPTGIVSTGWPAVEKTCRLKLGITFDDWQHGTGRVILSKRADGHLAAMIDGVGLSLPRQVGKTYLIGALVFALCVNEPGLLVIWSAHHARTHGETFLAMQGFAAREKVHPHVEQTFKGSGDEEIRFHNGSRILFGARERGFGRGIPGVDILIFDEAQILSDRAMSNMLATLNTSQFGLQLYIGTPPKPDDMSEAFTRMRNEAKANTLVDGAWIEFGADKDAKHDDHKQWAKANPSYPKRTPAQSMMRLKRKLTEEDWVREGLGIWDENDGAGVLPGWPDCFEEVDPPPPSAIGLGVSLNSQFGSIASADVLDDGRVNLSAVDRRPHTAWMIAEAKRIQDEYRCAVVVDEKTADGTLVQALEDAGVDVTVMNLADLVAAHSEMVNRVRSKTLTHQRTTELDTAVGNLAWRQVGDGRQAFGRLKSAGPIDMAEAAAAAMWGALQAPQGPAIW